MRGYTRAARMDRLHRSADVFSRKWTSWCARSLRGLVEHDLHQIASGIELIQSRAPERLTTVDFHTQREIASLRDPGACGTNVWLTGLTLELIADVKTDCTTIGSGRANVDSP